MWVGVWVGVWIGVWAPGVPFALGLLHAPWSESVERREVGREGGRDGERAEWGQRHLLPTCTTLSMISSMLSGRITSDTNCGWE